MGYDLPVKPCRSLVGMPYFIKSVFPKHNLMVSIGKACLLELPLWRFT